MQTRLISIGNSFGIRLPKTLIKQFELDKGDIEITVKKEGILITAVAGVAPLQDWDKLFKQAKKKGFNAEKDRKEFSDWNIALSDGIK